MLRRVDDVEADILGMVTAEARAPGMRRHATTNNVPEHASLLNVSILTCVIAVVSKVECMVDELLTGEARFLGRATKG